MIVRLLDRAPPSLDALLGNYFFATNGTAGISEREQGRSALAAAWRDRRHGEVRGAYPPGDVCGGLLLVEPRAWESSFFGCPVLQLSLFIGPGEPSARAAAAGALVDDWLRAHPADGQEYFVARLPVEDVPVIQSLEERGFRTLMSMVTLDRTLDGDLPLRPAAGTTVGRVDSADTEVLAEISRTAFAFGRFSVESRLPAEVAGEMHATWARNCANKSLVDEVLVARRSGRAIGFIAMRCRRFGEEVVGEIHLIAVDRTARGAGVGQALVQAGCNWARERTQRVLVRTELPNATAIRLYQASGFRISGGAVYVRYWRERASP